MGLSAKTILLVEDTNTEADIRSEQMKERGFNVVRALCPAEGREILQNCLNTIELVLIDADCINSYDTDISFLNFPGLPVLFLVDENNTVMSKLECIPSYGYVNKHSGADLLAGSVKAALNLQQKLQNSKKLDDSKYRFLVEYANEAIFVAQNNMLRFANPAVSALTGYSENELYSKPFLEFLHPDDREMVYRNYKSRIDGKCAPARYPFRIITKGGETQWVEINSIAFNWDGTSATLNFLANITERKSIEDALLKSEDKYRKIFENVQDIFYQTDPDGIIVEISPSIKRYSGFDKDELIGKPVESVYSEPADRSILIQLIREKGEVIDYEIRLKDRNGNIVYTSTNSHFLFDSEGNVTGVEGSLRDISERKRAEEALVKSLRQKEILMMELQHRVKNNLGIISSLLSLEMPKLKDETARAVFMNAQTRIFSMSGIYEQLYSSGNLECVDLAVYIRELAGLIFKTYSVSEGNITLKTSLVNVELDLRRTVPLGLILNELITNVIKYAYPSGEGGPVNIRLEKSGTLVTLEVSDNGVGLPENFSLNKTETMGLGLVRMLVDQIRGTLAVKSGKGTRISVSFQP